MSGVVRLLFTKLVLPPASAIKGKTILITGANTGLGREAVRHAARLGAETIIMGVRSLPKGEDAKADVESSPGCANTKLLVWPVDLESFDSVKAFASRARKHVEEEGGRLDMAIMNAGMASMAYATTPDGWERTIQVNVLSTTLLGFYLLPLLLRTRQKHPEARPHLAFLTSDIHMMIKFPERRQTTVNLLQLLNGEEQWKKSQAAGGPTERYGVTKLMDLYIAEEMAQLVPRDATGVPLVIINAVTPGFCKSELLSREKAPWILKVVQAALARPVEEGSKTLLHAVTQGAETHGKYLDHQSIAT